MPRSSVAKWPESGDTSSTFGAGARRRPSDSLAKCSSVPNGSTSVASSRTLDVASTDAHRVEVPWRALVREADATEQLVAGLEAARGFEIGEVRVVLTQLTETLQSNPRQPAERGHDVGLSLIRLVHHSGLVFVGARTALRWNGHTDLLKRHTRQRNQR